MTPMPTPAPAPEPRAPQGSARRGVQQFEGLLLWEGHRQRARNEAEAFARRLPWLTRDQRKDLEHHYAQVRLADAVRALEQTRARAGELREEYAARYAELRRRLLRGTGLLLCCVLLVDVALVLLLDR